MKISILTLFPEMFEGPFKYSIIKRAQDKKLISIEFINIRDFGIGKHKIVDDKPYGGGAGMVLRVDVMEKSISWARKKNKSKKQKVILMDPRGIKFNQSKAKEFSELESLIIVAGHYEGTDERIENFIDEKISIGDYILTGGEIPAMVVTDAITRLLPDVIKPLSSEMESFSKSFQALEHPHYTKPRTYKNLSVPKILLSGDHKKIDEWRKKQSLTQTKKLRPDLL